MWKILLVTSIVCFAGGSVQEIKICNEGLGECVAFDRCSNLTQFTYWSEHIITRFGEEAEECHYLEVCCDPEDVIVVKVKVNDLASEETLVTNRPEKEETDERIDSSFETTIIPKVISNESQIAIDRNMGAQVPLITDGVNREATDNLYVEPQTEIKEMSVEKCIRECSFPSTASSLTNRVETTETPKQENTCDDDLNECIPFMFCANRTFADGSGILNSRFSERCPGAIDVCCDKSDNLKSFVPSSCGLRNTKGILFQVGDSKDEAQFGEFPWMMALSEVKNSVHKYFCGGSLIHPSVVLTGAHCVNEKDAANLIARSGEWDTQTTNELLIHSDHLVKQIIIHNDFGKKNLFNDVALLVLENPVKLSAHVNTICLPPQNYKVIHSECFASGWGADSFEQKGSYRENLKKVKLPIVPQKDCQDSLRSTKLGTLFKLNSSFMCAGGEKDVDTCVGDGGSPLVCPVGDGSNFYYQTGIVAWGIECGKQGVPGVYVNVAKYRNWIDKQMIDLGFDSKSYSL